MGSAVWNIVVSEETDRSVRSHLAEFGGEAADLAKFVEDAVCRRLFQQSVADMRAEAGHLSFDEITALVDEAVDWARKR